VTTFDGSVIRTGANVKTPIQVRSSPLSSRGLGRRPLTAETRVRIPVAVLLFCLQTAMFGSAKPGSGGRIGGRLQESAPSPAL
jgi:hypothetical protein